MIVTFMILIKIINNKDLWWLIHIVVVHVPDSITN